MKKDIISSFSNEVNQDSNLLKVELEPRQLSLHISHCVLFFLVYNSEDRREDRVGGNM